MFKHYTMNQVVLPIDLAVKLPKNDIAFSVNEVVESITGEAFKAFVGQTGFPGCTFWDRISILSKSEISVFCNASYRSLKLYMNYLRKLDLS